MRTGAMARRPIRRWHPSGEDHEEARASSYALDARPHFRGADAGARASSSRRSGRLHVSFQLASIRSSTGLGFPSSRTPAAGWAPITARRWPTPTAPYDGLNRFGATRASTDADRKYADAMKGYWLAFARSGDPNAEGLPAWPAYKPTPNSSGGLSRTSSRRVLPNKPQLDFFTNLN